MSRKPITLPTLKPDAPRDAPLAIRLRRAVAGARGGEVSMEVAMGGSHVLAGRAGTGKTTVLEMIALARVPRSGAVELFGEDVSAVAPRDRHALRRRIGMIFQEPRLIDTLSIYDNVALAARAIGRRPDDYGEPINEVLSWVGLGRQSGATAGDLADEARRRLAVARAVINRPDVVIADEPSGQHGPVVLRLLADLHQAGTTILVASRDGDLAASAGPDATYISPATASWPAGGERGRRA